MRVFITAVKFTLLVLLSSPILADDVFTVFIAKKVVTMDATRPEAKAVVVNNGRIVTVGSLKEIEAWTENREVVIDRQFEKKILFPGFIDPHMHPLLGGLQLSTTWITPESWQILDKTVEATQSSGVYWQRLKQALEQDKQTITPIFISWGWSEPEHGPMTREMLDKLNIDKPIMIWQRSTHEAIFNTAGLKWMKFSEKDIEERYQHTINYTEGHFAEAGFFEVAVPRIASYLLSPEFLDKSFDSLNTYLRHNGITTVGDMAFGAVSWEMESANYQRNLVDKKVPFRTVLIADAYKMSLQKGGLDKSFDFINNIMETESSSPQLVHGKRVKMFSDGAIFSQLMQMYEPGYIDGHKGEWITPPDEFLMQARKYWKAGYRIHVHSNGDEGIDNTLDVLETLQLEYPRPKHSMVVEHFGYADERISRRTANLGAAVSANPYYLHLLADSFSKVGLGADRASRLVPLSLLVDKGVPVSLHSDFGMAPAEPLRLAWSAATRTSVSGEHKTPPRPLTVNEALRGITIDAAYILGMEKDIGSIQSGKKADFVVLAKDPRKVKPNQLKDVKVITTVFEGVVSPYSQD